MSAGAELIIETARFWASRGQMEPDGRYHIRHVIGPDEYHENVDDSAYTNLLAAWNLDRALDAAHFLEEHWPERWRELALRLQVTPEEMQSWSRLSAAMFLSFDPATKLYEQFQGFYGKEGVDLQAYEPRNTAMDVILGHERIQHVNVVKQADVLMAMYLLWHQFPADVRAANFTYYEPKTGHGSSLSPSIHALLAARFRDLKLAEKYIRQAAEIDLGNNMGNAAGGVHAAAIGGLWQAIVMGFAGVDARRDGVTLDPVLLPAWKRLVFPLQWRGRKLRISIEPERVRAVMEEGEPCPLSLAGRTVRLIARQQMEARRTAQGWGEWQELR